MGAAAGHGQAGTITSGAQAAAGRAACPQVTLPIPIPLQRARAVLQESKQALKHASQLATLANDTQRELSRQQSMAEKLRGHLEEAQQVSWIPLGRLGPPEHRGGFVHSPKHREQPCNALGMLLASPLPSSQAQWCLSLLEGGVGGE